MPLVSARVLDPCPPLLSPAKAAAPGLACLGPLTGVLSLVMGPCIMMSPPGDGHHTSDAESDIW